MLALRDERYVTLVFGEAYFLRDVVAKSPALGILTTEALTLTQCRWIKSLVVMPRSILISSDREAITASLSSRYGLSVGSERQAYFVL